MLGVWSGKVTKLWSLSHCFHYSTLLHSNANFSRAAVTKGVMRKCEKVKNCNEKRNSQNAEWARVLREFIVYSYNVKGFLYDKAIATFLRECRNALADAVKQNSNRS